MAELTLEERIAERKRLMQERNALQSGAVSQQEQPPQPPTTAEKIDRARADAKQAMREEIQAAKDQVASSSSVSTVEMKPESLESKAARKAQIIATNPYVGLTPEEKLAQSQADMQRDIGQARRRVYESSLPGSIAEVLAEAGGISPKLMQFGYDTFNEGGHENARTAARWLAPAAALVDVAGPGIILNKMPAVKQAISNFPASISKLTRVGEAAMNSKIPGVGKSVADMMRVQHMQPKKDAPRQVKEGYDYLVKRVESLQNAGSIERGTRHLGEPNEGDLLTSAQQDLNRYIKTHKQYMEGNDEFSDLGNLIAGGIIGTARVGVHNLPATISDIIREEASNVNIPRPVLGPEATAVKRAFQEGYRGDTILPMSVGR